MTTLQKIVKYLAMAFAIFLSVSIISGICGALYTAAYYISGHPSGEMTEQSVGSNYTSLKVDISASELEIKTGEEFALETNHKNLECKENGEVLEITETKPFFTVFNSGVKVILTVPQGYVFDYADISTGAGSVRIDELLSNKLNIDLGAGELNAKRLDALFSAEIDGGAGSVTINGGKLNNADIDMGVGEFNLTSELTGKSSIDYGVGETNLVLIGTADDYRIELDKGIGEATLDGSKMGDDSVYGAGNNTIEIDGGVGELKIIFKAKLDEESI